MQLHITGHSTRCFKHYLLAEFKLIFFNNQSEETPVEFFRKSETIQIFDDKSRQSAEEWLSFTHTIYMAIYMLLYALLFLFICLSFIYKYEQSPKKAVISKRIPAPPTRNEGEHELLNFLPLRCLSYRKQGH